MHKPFRKLILLVSALIYISIAFFVIRWLENEKYAAVELDEVTAETLDELTGPLPVSAHHKFMDLSTEYMRMEGWAYQGADFESYVFIDEEGHPMSCTDRMFDKLDNEVYCFLDTILKSK